MASGRHKPFLPFEIIINILKRLPIKSIVRFQCVCKDWKNLFKTQSFIAEQVRHSAHENPLLLIHAYDYECRRSSLRLFNHKMETVEVLRTPSIFSRGWRIIGSSNGLLCVQLDADEDRFPISLCLWNPVSNELREVPEPLYDYTHTCAVGFGFSRVVNDYKIVGFYNKNLLRKDAGNHNRSDWLDCGQVYSLRTGSWKELEMKHIHTRLFTDATSVDGTIFWFGGTFSYETLVAFDIATELFTLTPMHALSLNVGVRDLVLLYMLGNKLAMCEGFVSAEELSKPYSFHIWVIEECAGESGKSYNCTEKHRIAPTSKFLIPLCIWRNEIVCQYEKNEAEEEVDQRNFLFLFNLTTKDWKKFPCFSAAYDHCDIFNYERSLASVCNTLVD
ncbi:hypothetical protein QN277_005686 [Acacia crassicarpa]|uniref:F-box domain-containing protein n=1 Tax=Acacia crassicarpa TaxID=499986 RepID=A0AAE1MBU2_9FABA|nr:hypothetical protein QN277_005686 [Acacia crassicarpa]